MPRGGKRPGGGRPPGSLNKSTISKEQGRAALREIVLSELRPLVQAQLDAAKGIKHFIARNAETGEFRRLTKVSDIERALNAPGAKQGSTFYIHSKDPSTAAFTDLMNRALDKAAEQKQEIEVSAPERLIEALLAGRARAAKAGE